MDNIATMLDQEIERTLQTISNVQAESEEAKAAMIKLDKLHNERIRELEMALKQKQRDDAFLDNAEALRIKEAEIAIKDAELKEVKKARWWKTALEVLGITVPVATTGWWMYKGMKFEEEGKIYSSRTAQWVGNMTRLFRKG